MTDGKASIEYQRLCITSRIVEAGVRLDLGLRSSISWRSILLQVGQQQRLDVGRHGAAPDNPWPQIDRWSADERPTQCQNVKIIVKVLPPATVESSAGHSRVALAVVADPPEVATSFVGKKNVGTQIDPLRGAFEAPPGGGKRSKIHGRVYRDKDIGVLRHGLVSRSEPSRAYGGDPAMNTPPAQRRAQIGSGEAAGQPPRVAVEAGFSSCGAS